jgi:hypothetical protein
VIDFDSMSDAQLRQTADEWRAKAAATGEQVATWNRQYPAPAPRQSAGLSALVRVDENYDWTNAARDRRRGKALQQILAAEAEEANQAQQAEEQHRALWRATSPIGQLIAR